MRQRIYNEIEIKCENANLNEFSDLALLIKQKNVELKLPIIVLGEHKGLVKLNKSDAMKLDDSAISVQIACVDNNLPNATKVAYCPIDKLINKGGYGDESY